MKKTLALILSLVLALGTMMSATVVMAEDESDLAYVQDKGTFVVGVTEFEPVDFLVDGEWTGFDYDLAALFAKELGVELVIQEINWNTKEIELEAKTLDAIWNGLTWTEERAEQMSLSDPYLRNIQCLVVAGDREDEFEDLDSLKGLQVAAEAGSAGEAYVLENFKNSTYIEKGTQLDCLTELLAGTCDAAVIDAVLANYIINKEDSDFASLKAMNDILEADDEVYAVAFRKDSDLTERFNEFLVDITEDGTLEDVAEKYGLEEVLIDEDDDDDDDDDDDNDDDEDNDDFEEVGEDIEDEDDD